MPKVTRWFIKSGMLYFVLALVLGLAAQLPEMGVNPPFWPTFQPVFWHALTVGWITQVIMGVSIWMFPGRPREEGFKAHVWCWLAFIFLNTGLLLRVVAEPFLGLVAMELNNLLGAVLVVSAVLQLLGAVAYLKEIWARVLTKSQRRKKRKSD